MQKPNFIVTEGDGALMTEARRVEHPLEFAPLLVRLPENTSGAKAVAVYEIADSDPRGWAGCAACHRDGNHKHGLVLRLGDGAHAALGRVCGETKHGYKHKHLIEEFDAGTSRADSLRRAVAAIEYLLPVAEYVSALPGLPQVTAFEKIRHDFESRFGKLYRWLQGANGRLYLKMWVQDDEEMIARRKRRDAKADKYIERIEKKTGLEPSRAEVEAQFAGDVDFSADVLRKQEDRQVAMFTGSFFFTKLSRLSSEANFLANQMQRALQPFDNTTSDKFRTEVIQARVREFSKAVGDAIKLINNINDATTLFSAANLGEIIRWANKRPEVGGGGTYKLEGAALLCEFSVGPPKRLVFPEVFPPISRGPLPGMVAAVESVGAVATTGAADESAEVA